MSTYSSKKKEVNEGLNFGHVLLISCAVLVVGVLVGIAITEGDKATQRRHPVQNVFLPQTLEIASDFKCSCGSCNDKNLAVCKCETALIEKSYIDNSLKAGKTASEVVEDVKNIYGSYIGS